jgi:SAM-dependent methyltransferase
MTIDIGRIAAKLSLVDSDTWGCPSVSAVSFPEQGYDDNFALEEHSFWFAHRNRCILEVVHAFPPPGPIFDVGGGNGWVAAALANAGFEVVLVEPGAGGIRNARRRGLRPLIQATVEDAGFYPQSLPAIGLFDVLEHVAEDRAFLGRLGELLVPGGMLYLTVPAYRWLWSDEDDYAGHWRRYSLSGLKRLLETSGFQVLFASYMFCFLPLPILLARTLPCRLRLKARATQERYRAEHRPPSALAGHVLDALCRFEQRRLKARHALPFGGSCLLVASREAVPSR